MNSMDECWWMVFLNHQLMLFKEGDKYRIPYLFEAPTKIPIGSTLHSIGQLYGYEVKSYYIYAPVARIGETEVVFMDLRSAFDVLPECDYLMAGKAWQIINWDVNTRYCPRCGVPVHQISPIAKQCPECRQEWYPRISPAIIVRVKRGNEILLVRSKAFKGNYRGLVAGFVEPGESLEECVHREVMEETGLRIKNLRYFGSQTWPYPSGIMIAFTADYDSGEIRLQKTELSAGDFFTKDQLPEIPKKLSIARKLIDDWLMNNENTNV